MKQREAVFTSVQEVTGQETFDTAVELTQEQRKAVHTSVMEKFQNDEVDFSESAKKKYSDDKTLSTYVSGLISNWLRKDKNLNGGINYVAKNPGSRAGSGDAVMKELRKLAKIHADDPTKLTEINKYIEERKLEIAADKAKSIEVDLSKIPAGLRSLVS
jgi:hypothetical protein